MQKDPWWVRHRTIGFLCGMVILAFGLVIFGILSFFEQIWMYFQGYSWDSVMGDYTHRKTGARR